MQIYKNWVLMIGFIIMFTCSCATAPREWTRTEKVAAGWSIVGSIADAYTTCGASNNPDNFERNPAYGKHPSNSRVVITIGLSQLALLGLAHYFPKLRLPLLFGNGAAHSLCAISNANLDWEGD